MLLVKKLAGLFLGNLFVLLLQPYAVHGQDMLHEPFWEKLPSKHWQIGQISKWCRHPTFARIGQHRFSIMQLLKDIWKMSKMMCPRNQADAGNERQSVGCHASFRWWLRYIGTPTGAKIFQMSAINVIQILIINLSLFNFIQIIVHCFISFCYASNQTQSYFLMNI